MANRGLLVTITEPPPGMEEEFNAWYDAEHLPERLAIPGFVSARRWVADLKPGEGKYLATYELTSPGVLETPVYRAHLGDGATPWTKRCLGATIVFRRWACEQIDPGSAAPVREARAVFVAIGDAPLRIKALGVLQVRHFFDPQGKPPYLSLYELADTRGLENLQVYRAYAT